MQAQLHSEPPHNCSLCPRLHRFTSHWRHLEPEWHNGPVSTFTASDGADDIRLLIVGLAPGLRGANRTGRPFTGDYAGALLYDTLTCFGFARGDYDARPDDSLELLGTAITNAVRCVPPDNKPVGAEIAMCRQFLKATIAGFEKLEAIVTLGKIAHDSTVRALDRKPSAHPFGHGTRTKIDGINIFSSYHCSRYNTNTGRLTEEMFRKVFRDLANSLRK
jgi:uracil-DNA glycosylase family 4